MKPLHGPNTTDGEVVGRVGVQYKDRYLVVYQYSEWPGWYAVGNELFDTPEGASKYWSESSYVRNSSNPPEAKVVKVSLPVAGVVAP